MSESKELGNEGEMIASQYLKQLGMEIVERNFQCKMGEIDIIAKDQDELVFVEVKTRSPSSYGRPAEAVNQKKKNHIYHVAEYFLMINHIEDVFCRIDVVEIYYYQKTYSINYIKNAILDRPKFKRTIEEGEENEEWVSCD